MRKLPLLLSLLLLSSCATIDKLMEGKESGAEPAQAEAQNAPQPAPADDAEKEDLFSTGDDLGAGFAGNYLASRAAFEDADFRSAAAYMQQTLDADPNNKGLMQRVTVLYVLSDELNRALPLADKWLSQKPDAVVPNLLHATVEIEREKYADALKRLSAIQPTGIHRLTVPLLKAWAIAGTGDYDGAIAALKELEKISTAFTGVAAIHAALISDMFGRDTEAAAYYATALISYNPAPLRLTMAAGNFYERTGKAQNAKNLYDSFTERSPANYIFTSAEERIAKGQKPAKTIVKAKDGAAEVLFDVASAFEGQQPAESSLLYSNLAAYVQPNMIVNQLLRGELLEALQQDKEAARIHEELLIDPAFGWAAGLRLARNYQKLGDEKAATSLLQRLSTQYPKRTEAATLLGDMQRNGKDYAAAIASYTDAIARAEPIEPKDWALFYARGTTYERAKLWESAEKDLEKALELSPEQPYVLNYLAYSWLDRHINVEKATKMLQTAVTLAPNDAFIIDSLGWAYFRQGEFEKAEDILQQAVELRPYDPVLIDHYGDALWRLARFEEARNQWRRALSFGPEAELKTTLEDKIKNGLKAEAKPENAKEETSSAKSSSVKPKEAKKEKLAAPAEDAAPQPAQPSKQ